MMPYFSAYYKEKFGELMIMQRRRITEQGVIAQIRAGIHAEGLPSCFPCQTMKRDIRTRRKGGKVMLG